MIDVNREDVRKLPYLGGGTFGAVYQKDQEVAYKIYHARIPDERGIEMDNPCLFLSKRRFRTLMNRSRDLKYTGGVLDLIRVDGHFGGVVIPLVHGKKLSVQKDLSTPSRVNLARQMVRNSKELSHHLIYPTDYKLNNLMEEDGSLKIIDTDDVRTHVSYVPNELFQLLSIHALNETICSFFDEYNHCSIPKDVRKQLPCEHGKFTVQYHTIEKYLDEKEKPRDVLYIDDESNLDGVRELLNHFPYTVVYVLPFSSHEFPEKEEFLKRIEKCHSHNIFLFDFVKQDRLDTYSSMFTIPNELLYDHENVKMIKKTIK